MTYETRKSVRRRRHLGLLCMAVFLLILTGYFLAIRVNGMLHQQNAQAIAAAVAQCAVQCYAVEGAYPESLVYLEQHYGLVINHRRYIVTYNAFSSNLMPEISVLVRGDDTALEGGEAP